MLDQHGIQEACFGGEGYLDDCYGKTSRTPRARSLKSPFSKRYFAAEYSSISDEELERMAVGTLRAAVIDGDPENGCFLAGQISGMVNREQTCKDIIEEIFEQTEKVLKGASQWVK